MRAVGGMERQGVQEIQEPLRRLRIQPQTEENGIVFLIEGQQQVQNANQSQNRRGSEIASAESEDDQHLDDIEENNGQIQTQVSPICKVGDASRTIF